MHRKTEKERQFADGRGRGGSFSGAILYEGEKVLLCREGYFLLPFNE
jgi:hypothetical protein